MEFKLGTYYFQTEDKYLELRLSKSTKYCLSIDHLSSDKNTCFGSLYSELEKVDDELKGNVISSTILFLPEESAIGIKVHSKDVVVLRCNEGNEIKTYLFDYRNEFYRELVVLYDKDSAVYLQRKLKDLKVESELSRRQNSFKSIFSNSAIKVDLIESETNIPFKLAGNDEEWSKSELYTAMETRFPRLRPYYPWAVWLIEALYYEIRSVNGILIEHASASEARRRGCAVFTGTINKKSKSLYRLNQKRLWTVVHEIGHCLNLVHTNERNEVRDQSPCFLDDAGSLSNEYFKTFDFSFNQDSLFDLQHGPFERICPGQSNFMGGSSNAETISDSSFDKRLNFSLIAEKILYLGEPLLIKLLLSNKQKRNKAFWDCLDPSWGYTVVTINSDSGEKVYKPLVHLCGTPQETTVRYGKPLKHYFWVHSDENELYFPLPGKYTIQAKIILPNGNKVFSNSNIVEVLKPQNDFSHRWTDALGELQLRENFELLGSDCLNRSGEKCNELIEAMPESQMATKLSMIQMVNAQRNFKLFGKCEKVEINHRPPDFSLFKELYGYFSAGSQENKLLKQYFSHLVKRKFSREAKETIDLFRKENKL